MSQPTPQEGTRRVPYLGAAESGPGRARGPAPPGRGRKGRPSTSQRSAPSNTDSRLWAFAVAGILAVLAACTPAAAPTASPDPAPVVARPVLTPAPVVAPAPPAPAADPPSTPTPAPDYPFVLAQPLSEVRAKDAELAAAPAAAPWLADGIGRHEPNAVYGLLRLYDWDPELAWRILAYSAEEPVRSRNVLILNALGDMTWQNPDSFELLLRQPWFADGLSADERAFVIGLQKIADPGPLYSDFLDSHLLAQSRAADVDIWVFHHGADLSDHGANAARMLERAIAGNMALMDAPFPLTDVIVMMVDGSEYGWEYVGGVNFADSMLLAMAPDRKTLTQGLLDHEVAHYYLAGDVGPLWLVEGGAKFAAAYLAAAREGGQVEADALALKECEQNGVPNIHALSNPDPPDPVWRDTCDYTLGQYFMTALHDAVGLDAYAGALRELYRRWVRYELPATEEQIYRAFLRHAPPDREPALVDVYRRLHGGLAVGTVRADPEQVGGVGKIAAFG